MLSLKNIEVHYGGVQALKGISIEIPEGSITCLIGANGAGKSTTLRAISGMVPLSSGEIWFQGRRIDGMEPEEIVDLGIGHVPEGKKLFLEMSVRDNLLSGAYLRRDKDRIQEDLKRICRYFPALDRAYDRLASNMSGGEQQMIAIGRGLMAAPKLLLLDEPSLGLSPLLTLEVGRIIKQIAVEGVSILLIEQNAGLALSLAQKCFVLETGSITLEGTSKDIQSNPYIKEAYLGLDVKSPVVEEDRKDQIFVPPKHPIQEVSPMQPEPIGAKARQWTSPAVQDETSKDPRFNQKPAGGRLDKIQLKIGPIPSPPGCTGSPCMPAFAARQPLERASTPVTAKGSKESGLSGKGKAPGRVIKRVFNPLLDQSEK
jgi:branched-chain amino acid transport system ATP-binding protein